MVEEEGNDAEFAALNAASAVAIAAVVAAEVVGTGRSIVNAKPLILGAASAHTGRRVRKRRVRMRCMTYGN